MNELLNVNITSLADTSSQPLILLPHKPLIRWRLTLLSSNILPSLVVPLLLKNINVELLINSIYTVDNLTI